MAMLSVAAHRGAKQLWPGYNVIMIEPGVTLRQLSQQVSVHCVVVTFSVAVRGRCCHMTTVTF